MGHRKWQGTVTESHHSRLPPLRVEDAPDRPVWLHVRLCRLQPLAQRIHLLGSVDEEIDYHEHWLPGVLYSPGRFGYRTLCGIDSWGYNEREYWHNYSILVPQGEDKCIYTIGRAPLEGYLCPKCQATLAQKTHYAGRERVRTSRKRRQNASHDG